MYREKLLGSSGPVDLVMVRSTNVDKTIKAMKYLVEKYYLDLAPFADWAIDDFFDMVKNLPYRMEDKELQAQVLQRPRFSLERVSPYVACANKAILIGAFMKLKGIPFGFVVSSNDPRKNYSHVFNWIKLNNNRVIVDATYPENVIFREKAYPKRKVYE